MQRFSPSYYCPSPLLPNATRVSRPVAAVFKMSPLCIWAVHMSQGIHVWSLHGSILCTHWSIFHLYILRKLKRKKKNSNYIPVLHAMGLCRPFGKPLCGLQIPPCPGLTFIKWIFCSNFHRKWTTNPLHFVVKYIKLGQHICREKGPQLSDQLVHTSVGTMDYTAQSIYNSSYIVLWHNDFCTRGCGDHRNLSSIVCQCQ